MSVADNFTGFRAQTEMRTQRNKELINSNAISGFNSPDKRLT